VVKKMVTDVVMPRYSLTMQKGTIVKWLKKEGEAVEKGAPIVEIEADKVTTEVESPVSGFLLKICAQENTEVPVSEPLAYIGQPGEPIPEKAKVAVVAREEKQATSAPQAAEGSEGEEAEIIRASPVARKLAKQHGVDLTQITGTGPAGRITSEDVLQFVELHKDTRAVKEILPIKSMQRTIAERMSLSVKTATHCSITIEVDASRMVDLRRKINTELKVEGGVSYADMLVKAVATALKDHPVLNSTLEDGQLKIFEDVNIGVAVEVEAEGTSGLLVPVIEKADKKTLLEIAYESMMLIERARTGKASHEDLTGGTFTVTNLGMYDVETFIPIINPPESAILGAGTITEKPVVSNGKVEVKPLMRLTLSFDHRVINGAPAARFMQRLKQVLEEEISETQ
jgi:pyruvate dehydrogenase E2 component (dihydrolipoamide acetyltransferase)